MRFLILFALLATVASSCGGGGGDVAVPRPEAYYRVTPYPGRYVDAAVGDVVIPVNSSCEVALDTAANGFIWLDAAYPRYGAVLRFTLSPLSGKELFNAVDNRLTRMSLNSGGNATEIITLSSGSGSVGSTILVSPGATVTPVQILATDSLSFMLSGVLEMSRPDVSREEAAPVVKAVTDDLINAAKKIHKR